VGQGPTVLDLKARQAAKLKEIRAALVATGCDGLDAQASMLGLSRSTTWSVLSGTHKGSGLTASVVLRMLATPHLKPAIRVKILEYIWEKSSGEYGGTKLRLRQFVRRMREHDCSRLAVENFNDGKRPSTRT
jgi:hypothetical protein